MNKPQIRKPKKCFSCRQKHCKPKRCACNCHILPKNYSSDIDVLKKVRIVPRTWCPKCDIFYDKEYDFCKTCKHNLQINRGNDFQKKHYADSMGRIESLMHQHTVKERKERKQREEELVGVYNFGRAKEILSWKGKKSWEFWKKSQREEELHEAGLNEVHKHLGNIWYPWERKWK